MFNIILFLIFVYIVSKLAEEDLFNTFLLCLLALAVWWFIKAIYKGIVQINRMYNDIMLIRMSALKNQEVMEEVLNLNLSKSEEEIKIDIMGLIFILLERKGHTINIEQIAGNIKLSNALNGTINDIYDVIMKHKEDKYPF